MNKNYVDYYELVRDYPNLPCIIRMEDLNRFSRQLIDGVRDELEKQNTKAEAEKKEVFLLPGEVESTYHISRSTLYRLARAKVLIPVWVGGQRRYRRSDLEAYINQ